VSTADVVVIGAGIVGAACAAALARDGRNVLVLEAGFPAGGATGAGMGHLVVMDDSPAQLALASRGVALWREQAPLLPSRVELDWCGTLWLATNDDEMAALARRRDAYARSGLVAELLDAHDLARAEPMLRRGLAGALHMPGDGVMYQPVATRALLDVARSHGADVRSDSRVSGVREGAVRVGEQTIEASAIVVAAGALSPTLLPELPIEPRRGHLVITERAPGGGSAGISLWNPGISPAPMMRADRPLRSTSSRARPGRYWWARRASGQGGTRT
jgi:glycine/D-amino acid oxidase-like deaminating enzyme